MQQQPKMANVNHREFIRTVWSHRVGRLTVLKGNWYTRLGNDPEPRLQERQYIWNDLVEDASNIFVSFFNQLLKSWEGVPDGAGLFTSNSLSHAKKIKYFFPTLASLGRGNPQDYPTTKTAQKWGERIPAPATKDIEWAGKK